MRAVGHSGYEIDEPHRRRGYAPRAPGLVRGVARHYGVAPLRVLIAPENKASWRTAERAGLKLIDALAAPEAARPGPRLCRYVAMGPRGGPTAERRACTRPPRRGLLNYSGARGGA